MATRKYLKFGLRADKNLADLTDPSTALANVINDLTSVNNIDGTPSGFVLADLDPLFAFTDSDLDETYDYSDPDVPPYALTRLKDTRLISDVTNAAGISTTKVVEPQVTIQDNLNRFKTVFGDPPFVNGGSGATATFIPSDRIAGSYDGAHYIGIEVFADFVRPGARYRIVIDNNTDAEWDALAGTSGGSYAVGDIFTAAIAGTSAYNTSKVRDVTIPSGRFATALESIAPVDLPTSVFYTKQFDATLTNLETDPDHWDNGDFYLPTRLEPTFPDQFGAVQWEGYQDGGFNPTFETNGCLLVEQDLVENESVETNWQHLRGGLQTRFKPFNDVTYETVDGQTVITMGSRTDWARVGVNMTVTIPDPNGGPDLISEVESQSTSGDKVYLVEDLGVTESTGTDNLTFEFTPGQDAITYQNMFISQPTVGRRRRVRYTLYFPKPVALGVQVDSLYPATQTGSQKYLIDESGQFFSYQVFYKTQQNQDFSSQKFSYPFFRDNRASALKQDSNFELKVINTLNSSHTPRTKSEDITVSQLIDSANATHIDSFKIAIDGRGVYQVSSSSSKIGEVSKGDLVVLYSSGNSQYYSFPVLETTHGIDQHSMTLAPEFSTVTGISSGTQFQAIILKNNGLVGVYKYNRDGTTDEIQKIGAGTGTSSIFTEKVEQNDLLYKINFTGATDADSAINEYGFRVTSTNHNNVQGTIESAFTVESNPDSSDTLSTANGIVAVYRSRGLIDRSTIAECSGVQGKEVQVEITSGTETNQITISDTTGITAANDNTADYVYYDGVIDHGTTVTGINGNVITISADTTGQPLGKGSTLVFVKRTAGPNSDGWGGQNKEYCIIPLNTAPPWEGTPKGLKTPATFPNVVAKELRFSKLSFTIPETCITENPPTTTSNFLNVTYTDPG